MTAREQIELAGDQSDPQWAQAYATLAVAEALLELLKPVDDALSMTDNKTAAADRTRDGQTPNT